MTAIDFSIDRIQTDEDNWMRDGPARG